MNKKIAILTQAPLGTNYGNTVQAYALQTILQEAGCEPMVLDRVRADIYNATHWSLSQIKNEILNKFDGKNRLTPRVFNQIFKDHFVFVKEYINLSERLHTDAELREHFKNNTYDAVIVGSDQTWRPRYSPNIYNYFLDFLEDNDKITKLAYATSFGTSDWEFSDEETKRCSQLVQQFDAVSVREESAVAMTANYLNTESTWVLDPTLLLSKEKYSELANKKNIPKRSGLFSYILDETPGIVSVIEQTKKILGLDSFINQPKNRSKIKTSSSLKDLQYPSVESWLKSFEDADFIITNSFHGTVFSIINQKPFLVLVNKERGASRFYSLLGKLGLENRILDSTDLNDNQLKKIVLQKIDYTYANQKLAEMKEKSLAFLFNSLEKK